MTDVIQASFEGEPAEMETDVKKDRYEKIKNIGRGQFATVYLARDSLAGGRLVAIKKMILRTREQRRDGIDRTAIREMKLLMELHHENVIELLDCYGGRQEMCLVYELLAHDLAEVIEDRTLVLSADIVKNYMMQILRGLDYLHTFYVLHRDMKPNNLMVNSVGVLKIVDFGLAKQYGELDRRYTPQVVTRWYRAPELFMGATQYGSGVDIFASGCIMAELMTRSALFPGPDTDIGQLTQIFRSIGIPTEDNWPGVSSLPGFLHFRAENIGYFPLSEILLAAREDCLDLVINMLALNPLKRFSAQQCLKHFYFSSLPQPAPLAKLPKPTKDTDSNLVNNVTRSIKKKARLQFV